MILVLVSIYYINPAMHGPVSRLVKTREKLVCLYVLRYQSNLMDNRSCKKGCLIRSRQYLRVLSLLWDNNSWLFL